MVPPIRLKIVVLPEPFGPISAVIEPSGTANDAPSTARTPPKRISRPFTSSRGAPETAGAAGGGAARSRRSMPVSRSPASPALPRARQRSIQWLAVGMMPRGRNSTTSASSPPNIRSRVLPPPNSLLLVSLSHSMMNAPSTGPQSVARPPSSSERMIWTLSRMLNIPSGSMKLM